jgi:hypothetical protein
VKIDFAMQHDPQKALADLRDHLARHDKPIAFLMGAGTSCAVRLPVPGDPSKTTPIIPAVEGLTKECARDAANKGFADAWKAVEDHCKSAGRDPNVENILSHLRMMLRAISGSDTLCGLNKAAIEDLEETVRRSIARVVNPKIETIPSESPHRRLAQWLGKMLRKCPVEIFTLNYDVLIEHALEAERVPSFDGFVGGYQPFFYPDSLKRADAAPGANWVRLWKMHGSITWRRVEQDGRQRVVRGDPDPEGAMIYPSFEKYDESRQQPYSAFADRLTRFLEQDDALLIVAGFSFGDEHINTLIFSALENRPRTHVYSLQFDELPHDNELVKRAQKRPNMIVIGPETGIIGGRRAEWAPIDPPAFVDGAYELEDIGTAAAPKKKGAMKVGDFGAFATFLKAMTPV